MVKIRVFDSIAIDRVPDVNDVVAAIVEGYAINVVIKAISIDKSDKGDIHVAADDGLVNIDVANMLVLDEVFLWLSLMKIWVVEKLSPLMVKIRVFDSIAIDRVPDVNDVVAAIAEGYAINVVIKAISIDKSDKGDIHVAADDGLVNIDVANMLVLNEVFLWLSLLKCYLGISSF
ncbi:hypothetical protein NDU88_008979 [Pleurodeles waltl]|uniref:Uncharacterized protein n=1 Tax=Pleurodeles waltl TaxID=8319 RepID=A0AAV7QQB9_PLEWA|nr:hypothetical protein NDU88_008979 [Pleurodeles waltl]